MSYSGGFCLLWIDIHASVLGFIRAVSLFVKLFVCLFGFVRPTLWPLGGYRTICCAPLTFVVYHQEFCTDFTGLTISHVHYEPAPRWCTMRCGQTNCPCGCQNAATLCMFPWYATISVLSRLSICVLDAKLRALDVTMQEGYGTLFHLYLLNMSMELI